MKAEDILPRSERRRIGLIAGSGPEAGVDLWQKVIEETKALLGERYTGDLDGAARADHFVARARIVDGA